MRIPVVLGFCLGICLGWFGRPCLAKPHPNFIVIVSDDQSYEAMGNVCPDELQTPHLDQLANRGVTFTHAFNMGSWHGAVCIASRAMLMTGRSVWRAKSIFERKKSAKTERPLLWPELMQRAGYDTYMAGKWHLDRLAAADEAFQHTRNIRPGMPPAAEEGYDRPSEGNPWSPSDKAWGGHWTGGKHWSEVLADDAEVFIEQASQIEKPFFMYLAFNAPHDPRQSPQQFVDQYPAELISVPSDFLPEYPYKQEMGCYETGTKEASKILRDERLAPWPRSPEAIRLHRQEYYAIVTHMDEQVGRILQALEESGQDENTYILFTSDHGLACGHHGLLGKQNMYDHSVRVPLMVVGPGVPPGTQVSTKVYLQDIVPTTLELAGIEIPPELDFQSLAGLIQGESGSQGSDAVYGCYMPTLQRMVRDDRYKLIAYPQVPVLRLFDLSADPSEQNDLAQEVAHRDTLRRLFRKLQILQEELDDPLKLDAAEYDL